MAVRPFSSDAQYGGQALFFEARPARPLTQFIPGRGFVFGVLVLGDRGVDIVGTRLDARIHQRPIAVRACDVEDDVGCGLADEARRLALADIAGIDLACLQQRRIACLGPTPLRVCGDGIGLRRGAAGQNDTPELTMKLRRLLRGDGAHAAGADDQ
jgi:hypothetical protein